MRQGYKIAFFGSSLVSAYWNGAATYYRGLIRALHAQGASVTFYEPDAFERQRYRDIADPSWAAVRVFEPTEDAAEEMLDEARRADLVVKASGIGVLDEFLESAVLHGRRHGSLVAFWDVDAPATLERIGANASDRFRRLLPHYDVIFTYGGGEPVVAAYKSYGARLCVPIYNALDEQTHMPAAADARFEGDLGFLGNRLPDREERTQDFFFSPARSHPAKRFVLGGSGWEVNTLPENVAYVGHVYTSDHNAFNSTPKTILNICRDSMARFGYSPATRLFEAAGAAACIITDSWEGIDRFLEPGAEVLVARSGDEVTDYLNGLDHNQTRRIGRAARARVLREHTYARRALDVARVIDAVG